MLSVLIPIFNIDVRPLIQKIEGQLKGKVDYEIICVDDASTLFKAENEEAKELEQVKWYEQDANLGRSKVRNLLASLAQYPWLLFMDADTLPVRENYIEDYLQLLPYYPEIEVFFGGIQYRALDINPSNHLRYYYGVKRESKSVLQRMPHPYTALLMSNTLIKRSVFDRVQFNPQIKRYGHEDAVFSLDLYKNGVSLMHVDNPSYHTGVETNEVFLAKTRVALENLYVLHNKGIIDPGVNRMLRMYGRLKKVGLAQLMERLYKKRSQKWQQKLCVEKPSLFLFDMYRLGYFCTLYNQEINI